MQLRTQDDRIEFVYEIVKLLFHFAYLPVTRIVLQLFELIEHRFERRAVVGSDARMRYFAKPFRTILRRTDYFSTEDGLTSRPFLYTVKCKCAPVE